jgi:hypothetical protein
LEVSLISLKIHHKTTYRFNKPVALGPNRLMLRSAFDFQPRHGNARSVVTWPHDVFGNAVATATFQTMTDNLAIKVSRNSSSMQPPGLSVLTRLSFSGFRRLQTS